MYVCLSGKWCFLVDRFSLWCMMLSKLVELLWLWMVKLGVRLMCLVYLCSRCVLML